MIDPIRIVTEAIYMEVFGATGDQLRKRLGLNLRDTPNDDNLRDHMGVEALVAISKIERDTATALHATGTQMPLEIAAWIALNIARPIGIKLRADCAFKGIDPVTSKPLPTRTAD